MSHCPRMFLFFLWSEGTAFLFSTVHDGFKARARVGACLDVVSSRCDGRVTKPDGDASAGGSLLRPLFQVQRDSNRGNIHSYFRHDSDPLRRREATITRPALHGLATLTAFFPFFHPLSFPDARKRDETTNAFAFYVRKRSCVSPPSSSRPFRPHASWR